MLVRLCYTHGIQFATSEKMYWEKLRWSAARPCDVTVYRAGDSVPSPCRRQGTALTQLVSDPSSHAQRH
jgi:hypothetical protein